MVCMGGPDENMTANPAMGHRIDTANTVCYTQYITPWPLTHPCCAPVFFSSSVDCDRRQRNEVFHEARRQFTSIKDILISHHYVFTTNQKCQALYVFLQKLNNGRDFVALLRIYLEYHGGFEGYAAQPLKSELSGAARA